MNNTKTVNVIMNEEMVKKLDDGAKAIGITRGAYIKSILNKVLNNA